MILWGTPHQKASSSSSKSLIIKPPEFCSLMKPGNVGVAEATARLLGYISGQKGKAWVVKDLGLEPLVPFHEISQISKYLVPSPGRRSAGHNRYDKEAKASGQWLPNEY